MRISTLDIRQMKLRGEPIAMVTAYDALFARLLDESGIPLLLVGDSVGNTTLGYGSTVPVTLDDMVRHTAAVVRGAPRALVVADMPFLTYTSEDHAFETARRLIQEGGAQAVKLEGGRHVAEIVARLVEAGVPVMGHLGYTPQSALQFGRPRVLGKDAETAREIVADAESIERAGAFAVVLELLPAQLAAAITERLSIPTIGIGAGAACDGQVQVLHDLLGLDPDFAPRHARRFAELGALVKQAAADYLDAVRSHAFPEAKHASSMPEQTLREALEK